MSIYTALVLVYKFISAQLFYIIYIHVSYVNFRIPYITLTTNLH